jgi:hypothetical protein
MGGGNLRRNEKTRKDNKVEPSISRFAMIKNTHEK